MDKKDILVSDYRISALGDNGQYIFSWVDKEERSAEFVPSESDYSEYTDEVERAMRDENITIVNPDNNTHQKSELENSDEKTNKSESVTSKTKDEIETSAITSSNPKSNNFEQDYFIESSDEEETNDGGDGNSTNNESEIDETNDEGNGRSTNNESEIDEKEDISDQQNISESQVAQNEKTKYNEDKSEHLFSFIVRMSDASDRRSVIQDMSKNFPDSSEQLELCGPYRVTYRASEEGLHLVKVEDLGTGLETSDN